MSTMVTLFVLVIVSIFGFVGWKILKNGESVRKWLYFTYFIVSLFMFFVVLFYTSTFSVSGGESVLLTKFGEVYDQESDSGLHFKRPWASIVRWNTRLSLKGFSISEKTEDGRVVEIDFMIWWKVDAYNLKIIYTEVAKDCSILLDNFVVPEIYSAIRNVITKVNSDELYNNEDKYGSMVKNEAGAMLEKRYVLLDRLIIKDIDILKEEK